MKKALSLVMALCLLCGCLFCGVSTASAAETEVLYEANTAYAKRGDYLKRSTSGGQVQWYFESESAAASYHADTADNQKMRFYSYASSAVQRWTITNVDTAALVIPMLLPKNMRFTVQAGVYKGSASSETLFSAADIYVMQETEGEWQDVVIPLTALGLRNSSDTELLALANVWVRPMDGCTAEERLEYGETLGMSYPSIVNGLTLSEKKVTNTAWYKANSDYMSLNTASAVSGLPFTPAATFTVNTAATSDDGDRWRFEMRNVPSTALTLDDSLGADLSLAFWVNVPQDMQFRVRLQSESYVNSSNVTISVKKTARNSGYQFITIPVSDFNLSAGYGTIKRVYLFPEKPTELAVGATISYGPMEIWSGVPYANQAAVYEKNRYTVTCSTDGLTADTVSNLKAGDRVVVTLPTGSYLDAGSLTAAYTPAFGSAAAQKVFLKGDATEKGSGTGRQFAFTMPAADVTLSATLKAAADVTAQDSIATLAASVKTENTGLRFLTRLYLEDGKLRVGDSLYTVVGAGTQIVPADLTWESAVTIPAAVLYDKTEAYEDFTGVLTKLKTGNQTRAFNARGYVVYNDGAQDVTVYADTVTATYADLLG